MARPREQAMNEEIEPTAEQIRAMLAVQWPALYKHGLRTEWDGAEFSKQNEKRIEIARLQYIAAMKAKP
jgi:hypothetical protein